MLVFLLSERTCPYLTETFGPPRRSCDEGGYDQVTAWEMTSDNSRHYVCGAGCP